MTPEKFIENAFIKAGISNPFNQWLTLHNIFQRIGLYTSDNNIMVDFRSRLFYFNTDDKMLYIRYLTGDIEPYTADTKVNVGGYTFTIDGKTYYIAGAKNYKMSNVEDIGPYHSAISFGDISSFSWVDTTNTVNKYLEDF